jgi:integrase/recombinase XerD
VSLTPESFQLDGAEPVVLVPAAYTKNRKIAEQPVQPDVVQALREYLAGKPAGVKLWTGTGRWYESDGAEVLKRDLAAAGIPYAVPGPHGPEYADFQALRHSYITNVVESGASVKMAQTLARHSTPTLTIGRYAHVQRAEKTKAAAKLPTLVRPPDDALGQS